MHISKSIAVKSIIAAALIATAVIPASANAQVGLKEGLDEIKNNTQGKAGIRDFNSPQDVIVAILRIFLSLVAIIAGGFLYITSAGDENRAATGKKIVLYAIVGLLLMAAAAIVVNVIINIFFAGGGQGGGGLGGEGNPNPIPAK